MTRSSSHPFFQEDYIGSDYYGSASTAYQYLMIAHDKGVTASTGRTRYEPGNTVIVSARSQNGNIYGFLGIAQEVLDETADKFWGGPQNGRPVNKIEVVTPITYIPDELYTQPGLAGFQVEDREKIAEHLMKYVPVTA